MNKKPNIKYIEQFIRSALERRASKFICSIQEEGYDKDCGRHARRLLNNSIEVIVAEANAKIDKEAERLGFRENGRAVITAQDYWANQFHSPEYWAAEERVNQIRTKVHDETQKLALRVAMGMDMETLEKAISDVDFYQDKPL